MKNTSINLASTKGNFKKKRILELEKDYESSITDMEIIKRAQELNSKILSLLGKDNNSLLQEYTNIIVSRYNKDAEWFYSKGFEDSLKYATEYVMFS